MSNHCDLGSFTLAILPKRAYRDRFAEDIAANRPISFADVLTYPYVLGDMARRLMTWSSSCGTSWSVKLQNVPNPQSSYLKIIRRKNLKNFIINESFKTCTCCGHIKGNGCLCNSKQDAKFLHDVISERKTLDNNIEANDDTRRSLPVAYATYKIMLHSRIASGGRILIRYISLFETMMDYILFLNYNGDIVNKYNLLKEYSANVSRNSRESMYTQNDNTFDNLEEYTKERPAPNDLVPNLNVQMRLYQKRSLQFCLDVEREKDKIWIKLKNNLYYSPYVMHFSKWGHEPRGGFLCDEMGLGKTIVSLGLIVSNPPRDNSPPLHGDTLVVCPVSLVSQWVNEANKHITNGTKIYLHHGSNRLSSSERIAENNIVVTTYGILAQESNFRRMSSRRKGILERIKWHRIVFDESHILKNSQTLQYRTAVHLNANHKWIVTGTPSDDDVQIMKHFKLISSKAFDNIRLRSSYVHYTDPIITFLSKFMIRHKKDMIINGKPILELPECTMHDSLLQLQDEEREHYENNRQQALLSIPFSVGIAAFRLIQNLRRLLSGANDTGLQTPSHMPVCSEERREYAENRMNDNCSICLDLFNVPVITPCNHIYCFQCITNVLNMSQHSCPLCRRRIDSSGLSLVYPLNNNTNNSSIHHSKVNKIKELVEGADESDKFLIFFQFQHSITYVEKMLNEVNWKYKQLHGGMSQRAREKALHAFEHDPETRIFLLSVRSGSVGINLTSANRVILFEPCMQKSVEKQAIGRVWRMGQTRPVRVDRLITENTLEQKIADATDETWNVVSIRNLVA